VVDEHIIRSFFETFKLIADGRTRTAAQDIKKIRLQLNRELHSGEPSGKSKRCKPETARSSTKNLGSSAKQPSAARMSWQGKAGSASSAPVTGSSRRNNEKREPSSNGGRRGRLITQQFGNDDVTPTSPVPSPSIAGSSSQTSASATKKRKALADPLPAGLAKPSKQRKGAGTVDELLHARRAKRRQGGINLPLDTPSLSPTTPTSQSTTPRGSSSRMRAAPTLIPVPAPGARPIVTSVEGGSGQAKCDAIPISPSVAAPACQMMSALETNAMGTAMMWKPPLDLQPGLVSLSAKDAPVPSVSEEQQSTTLGLPPILAGAAVVTTQDPPPVPRTSVPLALTQDAPASSTREGEQHAFTSRVSAAAVVHRQLSPSTSVWNPCRDHTPQASVVVACPYPTPRKSASGSLTATALIKGEAQDRKLGMWLPNRTASKARPPLPVDVKPPMWSKVRVEPYRRSKSPTDRGSIDTARGVRDLADVPLVPGRRLLSRRTSTWVPSRKARKQVRMPCLSC
jgi:hypothetical protein